MEKLSLPLLLQPELASIISYFYQLLHSTLEKWPLAEQIMFHYRHSRSLQITLQCDPLTKIQKKESKRKCERKSKTMRGSEGRENCLTPSLNKSPVSHTISSEAMARSEPTWFHTQTAPHYQQPVFSWKAFKKYRLTCKTEITYTYFPPSKLTSPKVH